MSQYINNDDFEIRRERDFVSIFQHSDNGYFIKLCFSLPVCLDFTDAQIKEITKVYKSTYLDGFSDGEKAKSFEIKQSLGIS